MKNITTDKLASGFQVSENNPMLGIDSLAQLFSEVSGRLY